MQIDGLGSNSVHATESASMYDVGENRLIIQCAMILNHTIIKDLVLPLACKTGLRFWLL